MCGNLGNAPKEQAGSLHYRARQVLSMAHTAEATSILIADHDKAELQGVNVLLKQWGYQTVIADDGVRAWQILSSEQTPPVAILPWQMPGLSGAAICRKLREIPNPTPPYVILLTASQERGFLVEGLEAGADDYIVKPFDEGELRARIRAGLRMVEMRLNLFSRVKELEKLLGKVNRLQGLLPMCAWCRKIRNDKSYWQNLEHYLLENSEARFTHGICPDCLKKLSIELDRQKQMPDL